jgi:hypothetical protein
METPETHPTLQGGGMQEPPVLNAPGGAGPQSDSPERAHSAYGLIREFLVDVLGILIPGMLFVLVVSVLLTASGVCFLSAFDPPGKHEPALSELLGSQVNAFHVWLLVIVGYVVGGTFFRQDPKRPDQKSIERILRGSPRSDLVRSEVQLSSVRQARRSWYWPNRVSLFKVLDRITALSDKLSGRETTGLLSREEAAEIGSSQGAQFPYSHIGEYLEARGFSRLARIVPWTGDTYSKNRSKMFINMLKIRLQLVVPAKCGDIVRNEAHVRMMSSVWFAARILYVVCWLSALPVLTAVWRLHAKGLTPHDSLFSHDVLVYCALVSFVAISAHWLKGHVESCFHYQRVREVFYVLETAFSVANSGHPEILENLPALEGGPVSMGEGI